MPKRIKKSAISARARHHDSTETRAAILKAAERIYAECGLAGARTEAIAAAAGVNKALL
ncbi:MAG: TetR family transcriptional regulator [Acidobacteriia bacterium]|nr:TetR family transcriptional regulator [Terriglobia bacterium]